MTIDRSKMIKTVEGSSAPNPFPGKGVPPMTGAQFPKETGMSPIVVRADTTPILPRGVVSPGMIDESVGGQEVFMDKMVDIA